MSKKGKVLTTEERSEITRLYIERHKVADIADAYGIDKSEVSRIAVENGASPRKPNYFGTGRKAVKQSKNKVCPNCKKTVSVAGAKFCCFCGADIRTKREILVEKQKRLLQYMTLLPEAVRDECRDTILATIEELKG